MIYFIDNELQNNYYDSFKDKNYTIIKNGIFKIIYAMKYGPMSNLNNEYYLKYRIEISINYFNNIKLDELDIKKCVMNYKLNTLIIQIIFMICIIIYLMNIK